MTDKELRKYFDISSFLVNNLLNISTKYKYVYFETPKVACSTIKKSLQLLECDEKSLPFSPHDKKNSPLISPLDFDGGGNMLFSYFKFSFVRSPYTRILSCYLEKFLNKKQETRLKFLKKIGINEDIKISFEELLLRLKDIEHKEYDKHYMPQYLLLGNGKTSLDFVGRFENFNDDFSFVLNKINPNQNHSIKNITWHKTNANEQVNEYLNPKTIALINEIYKKDFIRFNYELR